MKAFFAWMGGFIVGYTLVGLAAVWLTGFDLTDWTWQRLVIYVMQTVVGWLMGNVWQRAVRNGRKR